jgi:hypothetical protein
MCDYSLEQYHSRPAVAGERYETHRFPSGTVGFVAPGDRSVAVCMACDTRLELEDIPEAVQKACGVSSNESAVFARLEGGPHFDGVRFANNAEVTLQRLGPGVKANVIDTLTTETWTREAVEA